MLRVHTSRRILADWRLPPGIRRRGRILHIEPRPGPLAALLERYATVYENDVSTDALPSWCFARYVRDKRHQPENWRRPRAFMKLRRGDCEDHVIYEVVRLRKRGIRAGPWVLRTRPRRFHAVVKLPNGRILDPSRAAWAARRALQKWNRKT